MRGGPGRPDERDHAIPRVFSRPAARPGPDDRSGPPGRLGLDLGLGLEPSVVGCPLVNQAPHALLNGPGEPHERLVVGRRHPQPSTGPTTAPLRASISVRFPCSTCWSIEGLLNFARQKSLMLRMGSGSGRTTPCARTTASASSMTRVWSSSAPGWLEISPTRRPVTAQIALIAQLWTNLAQMRPWMSVDDRGREPGGPEGGCEALRAEASGLRRARRARSGPRGCGSPGRDPARRRCDTRARPRPGPARAPRRAPRRCRCRSGASGRTPPRPSTVRAAAAASAVVLASVSTRATSAGGASSARAVARTRTRTSPVMPSSRSPSRWMASMCSPRRRAASRRSRRGPGGRRRGSPCCPRRSRRSAWPLRRCQVTIGPSLDQDAPACRPTRR